MLTLKQLKPTQITLLAVNIVTTLVASGLLVWDYLVRLWYSTQYQFFLSCLPLCLLHLASLVSI